MNNKKRKLYMTFLMLALLIMTVGYAAFIQKLDINGTASITSRWDIEIIGIDEGERTGSPSSKKAEYNATSATFAVDLNSPGDKMPYTIYVKNNGTLDAELESVNITHSENPAIIFNVSNIEIGEVIHPGDTKEVYASVEYSNMIETQPSVTLSTFTVQLNFKQHTGETPTPPLALDTSDFKIESANIEGYENVITSLDTIRDEINIHGNWRRYGDTGILKITLPKQYKDKLDGAKYTLNVNGPGNEINNEYDVKSLLMTSPIEEEQYMYIFVKYYDPETTQTIKFNIDNNEHTYKLNLLLQES